MHSVLSLSLSEILPGSARWGGLDLSLMLILLGRQFANITFILQVKMS
jgi:hypothetical protein